ncbi:hypothetical protein V8D89_015064 [Ganoderma adspersum]
MMNNNRGVAPAGRSLRTPLPPPPRPDSEDGLTFKPSQRPWVKLLWSPDPAGSPTPFAQNGRSVQVYSAEQIPVSPTQYAGQNTEWLRSDQDTLYLFAKRVKVRVLQTVETQLPVPHVKLLPSLPNPHTPLNAIQAPRVRYPTNRGTVVYTKEPLPPIMFKGTPLEVKRHTGVTLSKATSRHQRPGDKISNLNPENMHYIVEIYVESQELQWVACARGVTANIFESLTQDKIAALNGRTVQAKPKIVSADSVTPTRRHDLSPLVEDTHE